MADDDVKADFGDCAVHVVAFSRLCWVACLRKEGIIRRWWVGDTKYGVVASGIGDCEWATEGTTSEAVGGVEIPPDEAATATGVFVCSVGISMVKAEGLSDPHRETDVGPRGITFRGVVHVECEEH